MAWTLPTVADFKAQFVRDFPYAPSCDPSNTDYVMDADISLAITQADLGFNPNLFGDYAPTVFLWLVAYFLVCNLQTSSKGLNAQATFATLSNSVGSVSQSFNIPEKFTQNAYLSQFTRNAYGMQYLTMALPFTVGNVGLSTGTTTWG